MNLFNNLLKSIKALVCKRTVLDQPSTGNLKPFQCIPGPKPLPLVGNLWRYAPLIGDYDIRDLTKAALFNQKKFGNIVREELHKKLTILHLSNPDYVESLYRQDDKLPSRRSFIGLRKYRLDRPENYSNGGIVPENGQEWFKVRSLFQDRMLSKSKISAYADKLDEETCKTMRDIHGSFRINQNTLTIDKFQEIFPRWSLGCLTRLLLDCDLDSIEPSEVSRLMTEVDNTLLGIYGTDILSTKWERKPDKCKYYQMIVKAQDFLHDFCDKQLKLVMKDGRTSGSIVHDWLYEDKIDAKDIKAFVIDCFMGGIHTTAFTLGHLIYHLGLHKQFQESIHEELEFNNIIGKETLTASDMDNLTILDCCLQETLRLNPISIGTGRKTTKELAIGGYSVPEDIMVIVQNEIMSRDSKNFLEPHDFRPLRWKDYRSCPRHEKPSPFACRPFGLGARSCIGRQIIMLQMKIFMSRLLSDFQIEYCSEPKKKTILVHIIDGNVEVTLKKRSKL